MSSRRPAAVPPLAPAPPPPTSGAAAAASNAQSHSQQLHHPPTRKNKHATDQELQAVQVILQQERDRIRLDGGSSSGYSPIHPPTNQHHLDMTLPSPGLSPAMGAMSLAVPLHYHSAQPHSALGSGAITPQSLAQGWHAAAATMMGGASPHHSFPSPPSVSPLGELVSASGGSYFDSRASTYPPPQAQYPDWHHVQQQGAPQINTSGHLGSGSQVGNGNLSSAAASSPFTSSQHTNPLLSPAPKSGGGDRDPVQAPRSQQQPDTQMKARMKNNGDCDLPPTPATSVFSDPTRHQRQTIQSPDPPATTATYDPSSIFQTYHPPPPPLGSVPDVRPPPDVAPAATTTTSSDSANVSTPDLQQSAHDFHRNHHNHLSTKSSRTILTPLQTCVLRRVLATTVFPSTQLRMILARELGLSPRTVQIWFQNRRQKMKLLEKQKATNGGSTDDGADEFTNSAAAGMFLEVKTDADLVAEAIAASSTASDALEPPSPLTHGSSLPPMPQYSQHNGVGYYQQQQLTAPLMSPPPTAASSYSSSYGSSGSCSFPPLSTTTSSSMYPTPTCSFSQGSTFPSPRYHPYQSHPTSSSSSSYMDPRLPFDSLPARSATLPHASSFTSSGGAYTYLSASATVTTYLSSSQPLSSPPFGLAPPPPPHQLAPPPFPPASLLSPRYSPTKPNLRPIVPRSDATVAAHVYATTQAPVPLEPSPTLHVPPAPAPAPPATRGELMGARRRKPPPAPIAVPAAGAAYFAPTAATAAAAGYPPSATRLDARTPGGSPHAAGTALELLASAAAAAAADRAGAVADADEQDLMGMGGWKQEQEDGVNEGEGTGGASPSDVALRAIRGRRGRQVGSGA